jgi:hypothetical protein
MPSAETAIHPGAQLRIHGDPGQKDGYEYPARRTKNEDRNRDYDSNEGACDQRTPRSRSQVVHQLHTMMIRAMIETGDATLK